MDILESTFLEEAVSCVSEVVSNTHDSGDKFGTATQMCDITKVLRRVLLLPKRIFIFTTRAVTNQFDHMVLRTADLKLDELTFGGRTNKFTNHLKRCASSCFYDFGEVGNRAINNDLESNWTGAIVKLDKAEVFPTLA